MASRRLRHQSGAVVVRLVIVFGPRIVPRLVLVLSMVRSAALRPFGPLTGPFRSAVASITLRARGIVLLAEAAARLPPPALPRVRCVGSWRGPGLAPGRLSQSAGAKVTEDGVERRVVL